MKSPNQPKKACEECDEMSEGGMFSAVEAAMEKQFFENNELFMDTEFNEKTVNRLAQKIMFLSRVAQASIGRSREDGTVVAAEDFKVTLHINSYGGELYESIRLYDLIHAAPFKVDTVVHGKAMSAGAFLAVTTTGTRYCYPTSTIMVHSLNDRMGGTIHELKINIEEDKRLQKILNNLYQKHTGLNIEKVEALMSKDTYLNPKEAKKLGLVDVIIPSLHD